jgi:hypothetical protein
MKEFLLYEQQLITRILALSIKCGHFVLLGWFCFKLGASSEEYRTTILLLLILLHKIKAVL